MNGRVYDPGLGRFLSVDPVFQFPENTQSLNPYSYVLNSPLTMTDPTGLVSMDVGPMGDGVRARQTPRCIANPSVCKFEEAGESLQRSIGKAFGGKGKGGSSNGSDGDSKESDGDGATDPDTIGAVVERDGAVGSEEAEVSGATGEGLDKGTTRGLLNRIKTDHIKDVIQLPGESSDGYRIRLASEIDDLRGSREVCALDSCTDGNGTLGASIVTQNSHTSCAATMCPAGFTPRSDAENIHLHGKGVDGKGFRANAVDEALSGGAVKKGRYYGTLGDPNAFSSRDYAGRPTRLVTEDGRVLRETGTPESVTELYKYSQVQTCAPPWC